MRPKKVVCVLREVKGYGGACLTCGCIQGCVIGSGHKLQK